ncbi:MAG: prevent-host-death family protein [Microgenomates group bacterium Gr01-1014_7]|nr:MAG: prevent-host-death family protein [Microgenomates group bacterium Gr01-1014_7]
MTQVIPVTEARKDLLKLVDMIDEEYTRVDLTKNGRVKATLVSPDYLDLLEETIYTLEHSTADIKEAEAEIARGEYVTLEEFKEKLKKRNVR